MKINSFTVPVYDAKSYNSVWTCTSLETLLENDFSTPIVHCYIFTNKSHVLQVVGELRRHLDFHGSFPPGSSSTPNSRRPHGPAGGQASRGTQALTLDAMRSAIRFQRCIAEAWIKVR